MPNDDTQLPWLFLYIERIPLFFLKSILKHLLANIRGKKANTLTQKSEIGNVQIVEMP